MNTELAHRIMAAAAEVRTVALPKPRSKRRGTASRPVGVWGSPERAPKLLGEAVEAFSADWGWQKELGVRTLLLRWPALIGAANAEHCWPEKVVKGVIYVRCESTAWATQFRYLAPQLVARFNEKLGQGQVTKVVFSGPEPPRRVGRLRVPGRGPRDTYG